MEVLEKVGLQGCEFTAEELAENAELSNEELDGVAGGLARSQVLFKAIPGGRVGQLNDRGENGDLY